MTRTVVPVVALGWAVALFACGSDDSAGEVLTSTMGPTGSGASDGGAGGETGGDGDGGTAEVGDDGTGGGDDGAEDTGGQAGDWEVDDQMGGEGTISWSNGDYEFLLEQVQGSGAPWPSESRLWLTITSRSSSYETTSLLSRFHGLYQLGGEQFLVHPGLVTSHAVEEVGGDGMRIWLEYAEPYDDFFQGGGAEGRPSVLLGTASVAVTVRWQDPQVDLDLERPMLVDSANHNGFFSVSVRPDDFPWTVRMGVDSHASAYASLESSERHGEDPFGFFVREDGMLGRYDGYTPTGSVSWNDFYALERGDRATVVHMPDFRDIAVRASYDAGFYANWITPRAHGVSVAITQTGLGATYSFLPLPAGDYAERVTLLVDRDLQADLDGYQAMVDGIR